MWNFVAPSLISVSSSARPTAKNIVALPDRILITGCSTGIGTATALLLAQRGKYVVATARRAEMLRPLEEEARRLRAAFWTTELDVTDDASRKAAFRFAEEHLGGVDILINNAGYGQMGPVEEVPLELVRVQFETNLFGLLVMCQLALPGMRARGHGKIVNISSIVGKLSLPMGGIYAATKFALEGLTDALRIEVAPFGIQVILILPGPIRSEFPRTAARSVEPMLSKLETSPYRPWAEPMLLRWRSGRPRSGEQSAEKCAQVIARAIDDPQPRARYLVTARARLLYWAQKFLPDSMKDALLRKLHKLRMRSDFRL
jgi:NAD(P)-dependent dehydrogenase (short-subunit alcohol dehydrogenase family)